MFALIFCSSSIRQHTRMDRFRMAYRSRFSHKGKPSKRSRRGSLSALYGEIYGDIGGIFALGSGAMYYVRV